MTPTIHQLFIYPIKSLKGIALEQATLSDRGLAHDRRWMLVDDDGRFITQREHAELCFFDVSTDANGFRVSAREPLNHNRSVVIPRELEHGATMQVQIWDDQCEALVADDKVNAFFSEALGRGCKLVYMPSDTKRFVDAKYSRREALSAFGDGYPVLLIGSASLSDLNQRLVSSGNSPIDWDRFRPNIVVDTHEPFEEDYWKQFEIGGLQVSGVKLCSRCVFTTINQQTGEQSKEPLRTLAAYRAMGGKVMFGQNVVFQSSAGELRVGDSIRITEKGLPLNGVS
jgi:uncharacterized protein YcbX